MRSTAAVKLWRMNILKFIQAKPVILGTRMSLEDAYRTAVTYAVWANLAMDVWEKWGLERDMSIVNCTNWYSRLAYLDQEDVMTQVKAMLATLRGYTPQRCSSPSKQAFKQLAESSGVDLSHPIWCHVLGLFYKFARTYDPKIYRDLNAFVQFPTRLTLKDVDDLEEALWSKYLHFELDAWRKVNITGYDESVIAEMTAIIDEWFSDWDEAEFVMNFPAYCHHTGGALSQVQRGKGKTAKYRLTRTLESANELDLRDPLDDVRLEYSNSVVDSEMVAEFQAVPKGMDKKRGISMEGATAAYYQNGLANNLTSFMARHKHRFHVDLNNQTRNRLKCKMDPGRSLYPARPTVYVPVVAPTLYGTVDLSDASDSVLNTLVRRVFSNVPIGKYLQAFRSKRVCYTSPKGAYYNLPLEKFAPMGSTLCFPIESIIFSCIVEVARRRAGCTRSYWVYGDDIVIPAEIWDETLSLLDRMFFKVNKEKSFAPGAGFTESCGAEWFNGFDVEPVRVPRRFDPVALLYNKYYLEEPMRLQRYRWKRDRNTGRPYKYYFYVRNPRYDYKQPDAHSGAVDFVNTLYNAGYYHARKMLMWFVLSSNPYSFFTHDSSTGGILSPNVELYHPKLCRRYNKDLFRSELLVLVPRVKQGKGSDDVNYRLTLQSTFFEEPGSFTPVRDYIHNPVPQPLCIRSGQTTSHFKWEWQPEYE